MSSVESRIVTLKFDNAAFNNGVSTTLGYLQKLKDSLAFTGAAKGLQDVQATAGKVDVSKLSSSVDAVTAKFSTLSTVAVASLATIVTKAVDSALAIGKSFTTGPIADGFHNYETQINAVQTILANTGLKGSKGLAQVNAVLQELNTYANQTIYNFSDMTKNIGTFTAAGVGLKDAAASIKGIANLAALSGSTSEQASGAFYQLSQAIAAGTFKLQDYNSVVNAGLGGKIFQERIFETAKALHTLKGVPITETFKQWTDSGHSFRGELQKGFVTSKVLTQTLADFSSGLTVAQLKAQGYSADQIKQIQELGNTASAAATNIKTFSQLTQALKEEVATAYATIFKTIFGDINGATKLFSSLHTAIENALTNPIYQFNKLLEGVAKLGGRTVIIDSLKQAFKAFNSVLQPIKAAFREIFPATTAKQLYAYIQAFNRFTKSLTLSSEAANNIKRTFAGVFAIFDIGKQVVGAFVRTFVDLISKFAGSGTTGGILSFTGSLGDLLVAFDKFLKTSGVLNRTFSNIESVLLIPVQLLQKFATYLGTLYNRYDDSAGKKVTGTFSAIGNGADKLQKTLAPIRTFLSNIGHDISQIVSVVGEKLGELGNAIGKVLTPAVFSQGLGVVQTGLLATITLTLRKFFSGGLLKGANVDVGGGIFKQIRETLEGVTGTLKTMQKELKAKLLLEIAGALALLTASIVVLAHIDTKALIKALVAISFGFGILAVATNKLINNVGALSSAKLPLIGAGLIELSGAVFILSLALQQFAKLNIAETAKSLGTLAATLLILQKSSAGLGKNAAGTIRAATGLVILGGVLLIIGRALKEFAGLDYSQIARGLVGIAGSLIVIIGAVKLLPSSTILQAAGLAVLGTALTSIGLAMKIFASLKYSQIARGLVALAGSLAVIAGAIAVLPPTLALQAAGLVVLGVALAEIAGVLKILGGLSLGGIGKGLLALAGTLAILAGGLYLMEGALPGAAALAVAAGALALLVPVLALLGALPTGVIVKSLLALVGVFTLLGVAGLLLAPVVPVIIGLAAAVALIGVGFGLAGAGALAFAAAFGLLVAAGSAGLAILSAVIGTLIASIAPALKAFADGIVQFAGTLAAGGPQFTAAFTTILNSVLDTIIRTAPRIGNAFLTLFNTGLRVIVQGIPAITRAGIQLLLGLLTGIQSNIGKIVSVAVGIIVNFVDGISRNIGAVINAGVRLVLATIRGLTQAINDHSREIGEAGGDLAVAIVRGIVNGLGGAAGQIFGSAFNLGKIALKGFAKAIASHSPSVEFFKLATYAGQGIVNGLVAHTDKVMNASASLGTDALSSFKDSLVGLNSVFADNVDASPVIAPVIDLDAFRKGASKIPGMLAVAPINPSVSYDQASDIASVTPIGGEVNDGNSETEPPQTIKFEQNNYSPVALTPTEIYRQTQNQLSQAKRMLKLPA